MTLKQALQCPYLDEVDEITKIRWLSELDGQLWADVFQSHEYNDGETVVAEMPVYTESTDEDTVLLVPPPYDGIYDAYLAMRVDLLNRDTTRYNNSMTVYTDALSAFSCWYNRTHMPKQPAKMIF